LLFAGSGEKMSWSQRELAKRIKKKNEKRIKISIAYSFAANEREKSIKSCRQPSCKETRALALSHEGHRL